MSFESDLVTYIDSVSGITNLVSGLFPNAASGHNYPFATFVVEKDHGTTQLAGSAGYCDCTLTVQIWSDDYLQTADAAEQFRLALQNKTGAMGSTTIRQYVRCTSEIDSPVPPADNSNKWIYCREIEFVISYVESKPTP